MAQGIFIRQSRCMSKQDNFVEGLRKIFEIRLDLTPAGVSVAAGLDNSTVRKLLSGQNSSPRIETAERIAEAMGYHLSTILDIGAGRLGIDSLEMVARLERLPTDLQDEYLNYLDYLLEKRQRIADQSQDDAADSRLLPGRRVP